MELLRQLEYNHKQLWDQLRPLTQPMKDTCDCDPALLSGWTDRDISVWDIGDDNGKPGLQRILVALCRNKKKDWDKISYLKFPKEAVAAAGLELTRSNGKTGDTIVNLSNTHFEIIGITGKELCTLLHYVSLGKFETGVFKKTDLENILYENYDKLTQSTVQSSTSMDMQNGQFLSETNTEPRRVIPSVETGTQSESKPNQLPKPSTGTTNPSR